MSILDRLLTIEQVAEKLHVSVRTVRSWRYRRTIPFTRVGLRLYVDAGVVEEILRANTTPALNARKSSGAKPTGQGGDAEKGIDN